MPLNSYLRVFNSSGTEVAFNDDEGLVAGNYISDSKLNYTATSAGVYYVGVSFFRQRQLQSQRTSQR